MNDFGQFAQTWFDQKGAMGLLHSMNRVRIPFVLEALTTRQQYGLDIGTGGGLVPLSLVDAGMMMEGIDSNQELITVAVEKAAQENKSILYHCLPVEDFKPLRLYDFITCFEMLEHVDDPKKVCQLMIQWVKPGGWIFCSTLNRTLCSYLGAIVGVEYLLRWLPHETHSFDHFIKPEELMLMLDPCVCSKLNGMIYNPFDQQKFFLGKSLAVNYIGAWQKPL